MHQIKERTTSQFQLSPLKLVLGAGIEPARPSLANGFSYHYSFHYQLSVVCGLDYTLTLSYRLRFSVSSLYTFPITRAWLGIPILKGSPNLRSSTLEISF